jgi:hypothetical protein
MFERIISIDWSGADRETIGVDLRVAMFDARIGKSFLVDRSYQSRKAVSWSREAFRAWIVKRLRCKRPALVAMDFGFGLPWGSDQKVFGVTGWRGMIRKLAEKFKENELKENKKKTNERMGTSRATALAINAESRFSGHGPYRFDDNRNDFRFYTDNGVPYYRLTELIAPQGISQWYLGSGGTVGFHTISGLPVIHHLVKEREAGRLDFVIWPHECLAPDGKRHVLVESYPAVFPPLCCTRCQHPYPPRKQTGTSRKKKKYVPRYCATCRQNDMWKDANQEDAWKVLQALLKKRKSGTLASLFEIKEQSFGRITGVNFKKQIQFEGFIFGLN